MSSTDAAAELLEAISAYDVAPGTPLALVVGATGAAVALDRPGAGWTVPWGAAPAAVSALEAALRPRWVWWSAASTIQPLLARSAQSDGRAQPTSRERLADQPQVAGSVGSPGSAGLRLRGCWDLAAVHRLLAGGWRDDPAQVWAHARGLPQASIPQAGQLSLLDSANGADDDGDASEPVRPDSYLRPDWAGGAWRQDDTRALRWARLALVVQAAQADQLSRVACAGDVALTARSESAAALIAVELALDGLPLDRTAAEELLVRLVGKRPADDAEARQARSERDNRVLSLAPALAGETDLRNPAQVRTMLAHAGLEVPDTRSWRLERAADAHPVIPALLAWRKAERVATTYGYDWLDRHVGPDGRLRGGWTASDGGAGRMTAQTGLHNLPVEMRVSIAAEPGHLLVRADLGQVEPRVLAAVSGDTALAAAAQDDDLYLPVAARIGCTRAVAKVAVLAAMYGQTSGAAGQALAGMKQSYPVAIGYLDAADASGRNGHGVRTYGGRLVTVGAVPPLAPGASEEAASAQFAVRASRGRYLRNAVVQGAAAELFKAWAATVRSELLDSGAGGIVLCLHDELLLHVRVEEAERVAAALVPALQRTATRWFRGSAPVRFVASVTVVERWSDAKD